MRNSKIEWTDHTANYWWGCAKVSAGCANCYADTWAARFGKDIWGVNADRELKKGVWKNVKKWDADARKRVVRERMFVQSMSDFFEDHDKIHGVRESAKRQIESLTNIDVQLLTKRPENIAKFAPEWIDNWPQHIWIGTSVEDQDAADKRIPELLSIPAKVRFLSMEPLLGYVDLSEYLWYSWQPCCGGHAGCGCAGAYMHDPSEEISQVIVGGESGHGARPMQKEWVEDLQRQCQEAHVNFFFKQWGAYNEHGELVGKKNSGRKLNGAFYNEIPKPIYSSSSSPKVESEIPF